MKRLGAIVFLLFSLTALGQTTKHLTADQILDASIIFCGGEKRIAAIRTSEIYYSLIQPDSSTAIINEKRIAGQKFNQSVLSMTHVPQTTFFDGSKLSKVEGASVIKIAEVEAVEEIKLRTYDHIQYGYKKLGYSFTRQPDNKFQNYDCYVINARAKNGYTTMNFFDKSNFRLIMVIYPNLNKSIMADYIFKDSILFNSHIVNTFAGSDKLQELILHNAFINIDLNNLWFKCPFSDKVEIPAHIRTGKFESIDGDKTVFTRNLKSQDYPDNEGKIVLRRYLMWVSGDTFGLIDENSIKSGTPSPGSEILVRIISWDDNGYVCHWLAGNHTDTQGYRLKK